MLIVGKSHALASKTKRVSEAVVGASQALKAEDVECKIIEEAVGRQEVEEILKEEEAGEIATVVEDGDKVAMIMAVDVGILKIVEVVEILRMDEDVKILKIVEVVEILKMAAKEVKGRVKYRILWQMLLVIIVKKKAICLVDAQIQGKKENFQIEEVEDVAEEVMTVVVGVVVMMVKEGHLKIIEAVAVEEEVEMET